jgi:alpha-1,6-mannosyltransferase
MGKIAAADVGCEMREATADVTAEKFHPATVQALILVIAAAGALVLGQIAIARLYAGAVADKVLTVASVLPLMLLLALPALAVVSLAKRFTSLPATFPLLAGIAVTGLAMRLPFFGQPPMLEDDHYRYLLDGAMVANGFNPHTRAPLDLLTASDLPQQLAQVVNAGRELIAKVNFPDLRSMYPGSAQLIYAAAHVIAPWSLDGLRVVMMFFEFATFLLLLELLRRTGRSPLWAALYWCNPLMAFTLTGQAHVDAALPPLVLASLLLAAMRRPAGVGIALGLAVGVKFWPVLLAPLLARMLGPALRPVVVAAATGVATAVALCLPAVLSAFSAQSGLAAYSAGWSINNMPFAWVSWFMLVVIGPDVGERILRLSLAIVMGLAALGLAWRPIINLEDAARRMLVIAALLFYLSPAQFPWYAAWFLPLAALTGNRALLLASASLPVYYCFFPLAAAGDRDTHLYGLAGLHLLPVLIALAVGHLRREQGALT